MVFVKERKKREFRLYWSNLKKYEECPRKFLWSRGWEDIDLGGGPGKKKPVLEPRSREHACMGIAIQGVLEDLYNERLYLKPEGLAPLLEQMVLQRFENLVDSEYVEWKYISHEEARDMCANGVVNFLDTMKHNKLLGPYARSEVFLGGRIDDFPVGGQADFIIRRDDTGVAILDGKNSRDTKSKTRQQKNDPDQLRWYALCYLLHHKQLPDRVGYIWYQHPYDEEKGEQGVEWVPCEKRDLQGIVERARTARRSMSLRLFDAKPSSKACGFCDYQDQCDARQEKLAANRAKKRAQEKKKLEELGIVIPENGTFEIEL